MLATKQAQALSWTCGGVEGSLREGQGKTVAPQPIIAVPCMTSVAVRHRERSTLV